MNQPQWDAIIIGGGAAGLMCAATAAAAGQSVLLLEHTRDCGRKILMSGGGRCNFTNLDAAPEHYLSANPHFAKSALARYTPDDFFALAQAHQVDWVEKAAGQLFCRDSARPILNLLLAECQAAGVEIRTGVKIQEVHADDRAFTLSSSQGRLRAQKLVVASGGLSIPRMGATGFGYEIARQFGHSIIDTEPALVPFTLSGQPKEDFAGLEGLSARVCLQVERAAFEEDFLFTHRGVSGPVCLQLSNYWQAGELIHCDWLPSLDAADELLRAKKANGSLTLARWLAQHLPRRLAERLGQLCASTLPLGDQRDEAVLALAQKLQQWPLRPSGTEGYRTAEVTRGGVATDAISSRSFESREQPGLYFIGEVLDVTGQLGGYNFQWAWSSGHAAGAAIGRVG